jgi:plastocyanin
MRAAALTIALVFTCTAPSVAGSLHGRVELVEKGGKQARDLSDVVVWVEGPRSAPEAGGATIVMRGKAFQPRLVVVPLGGTVSFPNQDPIFHNAFSVSGENRFDLDLYKKPKSRSWTSRAAGVVRVFCNIHPQMSAIVLVRDNPYWARATAAGVFAIADVPPGTWVVKAWHERAGEVSETVTVGGDETQVALTLDASRYRRVQHKNKFGRDYKVGEAY